MGTFSTTHYVHVQYVVPMSPDLTDARHHPIHPIFFRLFYPDQTNGQGRAAAGALGAGGPWDETVMRLWGYCNVDGLLLLWLCFSCELGSGKWEWETLLVNWEKAQKEDRRTQKWQVLLFCFRVVALGATA